MGSFNTSAVEYYLTFSSSLDEAYFVRTDSFSSRSKKVIFRALKDSAGNWSSPEPASFSGVYSDGGIFLSADNQKIFFHSDRPVNGLEKKDSDLWIVTRQGNGWGEPEHLGFVINSEANEYSPSVASNGNLYFGSDRSDGFGFGDLYMSVYSGESFSIPVNLGSPVNTEEGEWGSVVSPDENFLIFECSGRDSNLSFAGDLYISFNRGGNWSEPENLMLVNTPGSDLAPRLSPDARILYFSSNGEHWLKNFHDVDIFSIRVDDLINDRGRR